MYFYKRIYVALDGSKEADYAFQKAIAICKRNPGSALIGIHVLDKGYRMNLAEMADPEIFRESENFANTLITHYTQLAEEKNIHFELKIKEGSPTSTLLKEFKALDIDDLVICGKSSLGRIASLLFSSSVSKSIVAEASCDVLVVKTPEINTL